MPPQRQLLTDPIRDIVRNIRELIANNGVSISAQKPGGEALQYDGERLSREIESLKKEMQHYGEVRYPQLDCAPSSILIHNIGPSVPGHPFYPQIRHDRQSHKAPSAYKGERIAEFCARWAFISGFILLCRRCPVSLSLRRKCRHHYHSTGKRG